MVTVVFVYRKGPQEGLSLGSPLPPEANGVITMLLHYHLAVAMATPTPGLPSLSTLVFYFLFFRETFYYGACVLTRETETERQKVKNHLSGRMATLQSLLHSPLRILGMYAHMPGMSFKPPGLGLHQLCEGPVM